MAKQYIVLLAVVHCGCDVDDLADGGGSCVCVRCIVAQQTTAEQASIRSAGGRHRGTDVGIVYPVAVCVRVV